MAPKRKKPIEPSPEKLQKAIDDAKEHGTRYSSERNALPAHYIHKVLKRREVLAEALESATDKEGSLKKLRGLVLAGLLVASRQILEQLSDLKMKPTEATRELRQIGEVSGLLQGGKSGSQFNINVSGNAEITALEQMSDEQLADRAERLAVQLRSVTRGASEGTDGDSGVKKAPRREPNLELLSGNGTAEEGIVSGSHELSPGWEGTSVETVPEGQPDRGDTDSLDGDGIPPDGPILSMVGRQEV